LRLETNLLLPISKKYRGKGLDVQQITYDSEGKQGALRIGMSDEQIFLIFHLARRRCGNTFQEERQSGLLSVTAVLEVVLAPAYVLKAIKIKPTNLSHIF
jgi:hypothetical protein